MQPLPVGKGKSEDAATGGEASPVPRRTYAISIVALLLGLLSALGLAACGSSSQSASTLETPPLTVDTGATLPDSAATTASTTTTLTTTTDTTATDTGGAVDTGGTTSDTGGTTGAGGDTGGTTAGGAPSTGGGDTGTPTTPPSNPGGAAPDYQSFCNQNPGAC